MITKVIPNGKLPAGKSKMDHSVLVTMGIFLFSRLIMAYKISKLQEKPDVVLLGTEGKEF